MRAYVDCVLALLPFEPAAHARLGGPRCVYVGHPLIERLGELRPNAEEARRRETGPPIVVVLPGSRRSIIARLMGDFGAALGLVHARVGPIEVVLPTLPHVVEEVAARAKNWPVKPGIVTGEGEKFAAFRNARAALAASGTVTLELALAGVPLVGAYRVSWFEEPLKYLVKVPSILLPNLVLNNNSIPELLQRDCTPERLAASLGGLIASGPSRERQIRALGRLEGLMRGDENDSPSRRAAGIVMETVSARS
jgi:lipid-A-disaccharide synthase